MKTEEEDEQEAKRDAEANQADHDIKLRKEEEL